MSDTNHNYTDTWNAERFAAKYKGQLAYVPARGHWIEFDGVVWKADELRNIMRIAMEFGKDLLVEASQQLLKAHQEPNQERRKVLVAAANALSNHALKTQSKRGLDAMVSLAQPLLSISQSSIDVRDDLFATQDCVYGLIKHQARPGQPDDLLMLQARSSYSPNAAAPRWERFLEEVQPDAAVRFWLQKFCGYCLTASVKEQVFLILQGGGENGKSVFIEVIKKVLGSYTKTVQFDTFVDREGNEGVRNDIAALAGVRLVVASEGQDGTRLNEGIIKQITGEDEITARFLHREFFTFKPRFKVVLVTNHKPLITGTDWGIWRRVILVPWSVTIPSEKRDKNLIDKLISSELDGILQWCIHGLQMYQEDGLKLPKIIEMACADYRSDSDLIGHWIADKCIVHEDVGATAEVLYESYSGWARGFGHKPISQKTLGDKLKERGFQASRSKTARGWSGIGVKS